MSERSIRNGFAQEEGGRPEKGKEYQPSKCPDSSYCFCYHLSALYSFSVSQCQKQNSEKRNKELRHGRQLAAKMLFNNIIMFSYMLKLEIEIIMIGTNKIYLKFCICFFYFKRKTSPFLF